MQCCAALHCTVLCCAVLYVLFCSVQCGAVLRGAGWCCTSFPLTKRVPNAQDFLHLIQEWFCCLIVVLLPCITVIKLFVVLIKSGTKSGAQKNFNSTKKSSLTLQQSN